MPGASSSRLPSPVTPIRTELRRLAIELSSHYFTIANRGAYAIIQKKWIDNFSERRNKKL